MKIQSRWLQIIKEFESSKRTNIVKEMVKVLFPATKNIDEVVGIIEKYRMKFRLNTGLRLAISIAYYDKCIIN